MFAAEDERMELTHRDSSRRLSDGAGERCKIYSARLV
jgi:hypothetical protein